MSFFISNSSLKLACSFKFDSIILRNLATHWDPKYRLLRAKKVIKPKLPEYDRIKSSASLNETLEEKRARFIKEGISPPLTFEYKPMNITTSSEIFDPYIPPEGDGKTSYLSMEGAKSAIEQVRKKVTTKIKHARLIRKHDESFDESSFGELAQKIYIDAHTALMNRDSEKLIENATELAYSKMWINMKYKTIRWKWVEPLEQPVIKHLVTRELLNNNDLFAQITVRFHSKQILAIYDRFGRLAFGSESLPKDILEYIVFERYITDPYSSWRLHDKIIPEWAPAKAPIVRSYIMPKPFKIDETVDEKAVESKFKKDDSHLKDEAV